MSNNSRDLDAFAQMLVDLGTKDIGDGNEFIMPNAPWVFTMLKLAREHPENEKLNATVSPIVNWLKSQDRSLDHDGMDKLEKSIAAFYIYGIYDEDPMTRDQKDQYIRWSKSWPEDPRTQIPPKEVQDALKSILIDAVQNQSDDQ